MMNTKYSVEKFGYNMNDYHIKRMDMVNMSKRQKNPPGWKMSVYMYSRDIGKPGLEL